jgi:hypothetical protein
MTPLDDAWVVEDPTLCPTCGREACEEHLPEPVAAEQTPTPEESAEERWTRTLAREVERERARREARRLLDVEARGPLVLPQGYRLRDWLTVPDPEVRWRIEGWQPTDTRVMLSASRKTGKTTTVASLVRSLVDGHPWLGTAAVTPVTRMVGLIDTEMPGDLLKRWYRDQGIAEANRFVLFPTKGNLATLDWLDPQVRGRWVERLIALDIGYLIIDNLRPILDALGLDENHEAGRWLVPFDALLREASIPEAGLVHHMGHNGERSRGDSRLRDWPDVEWRLLRQTDDDDAGPRFITAYGRDVDVPERQITYDPTTRRVTITGGTRHQAKLARALDAICEVLASHTDPLSGRRIKDALAESGNPKNAIDAALALGVRLQRLTVTDGSNNAKLYRVSQCPGVSQASLGHSSSESVSRCPTPYRGDTGHTPHDVLPDLESGHVPKKKRDAPIQSHRSNTAGKNTATTRRRAAEDP